MADKVAEQAFISFILASRAFTKYYDAYLYRKMRLSIVKMAVLNLLNINGTMSPAEIARITCTERNNITTLIRRMAKDGLVKVERNAAPVRGVSISLTEVGLELFGRAKFLPVEVRDQVFASIPKESLGMVKTSLETMRYNAMAGIDSLSDRSSKAKLSGESNEATTARSV